MVDCEQKITIKVLLDLKELELDMAEMRIEKCYVTSSVVKVENLKIFDNEDKFKLNLLVSDSFINYCLTVFGRVFPLQGFLFVIVFSTIMGYMCSQASYVLQSS